MSEEKMKEHLIKILICPSCHEESLKLKVKEKEKY